MADQLTGAVHESALQIIGGHLRPALDEVLSMVGKTVEALGGPVTDPRALMLASDDARRAWLGLDGLAARYHAVREGRRALFQVGVAPTADVEYEGIFGEFENLPEVWPTFRGRGRPPWPADPVGRLLWIAASPAQPWLPTPAEQDRRYVDYVEELAETPGNLVGPAVLARVKASATV